MATEARNLDRTATNRRRSAASLSVSTGSREVATFQSGQEIKGLDVARSFLRLADLDNGAFERLGRYGSALPPGQANDFHAAAFVMACVACCPPVARGPVLLRALRRSALVC